VYNGCYWLDLGCGHHLLPSWRATEEKELIKRAALTAGIDSNFGSLSQHRTIKSLIRGTIGRLPFKDNSFDIATSNMVFEHLDDPGAQLEEVLRILKPGGLLIFHTPNVHSYTVVLAKTIPAKLKDKLVYILEGRREVDVFPTYYRFNSFKRIGEIAEKAGFSEHSLKMICSSANFAVFPPAALLELLLIRILLTRRLKYFRTNIIGILKKGLTETKTDPAQVVRAKQHIQGPCEQLYEG
jgi:ubiquinone/menaquinone biosynthesis C-methylase UbiE